MYSYGGGEALKVCFVSFRFLIKFKMFFRKERGLVLNFKVEVNVEVNF